MPSLTQGVYWPFNERLISANATSQVIDTTGEKVAIIGSLYIDGRASSKTLSTSGSSKIGVSVSSRTWSTAGSTIDIGVQGVSTSGPVPRPDGTFTVKKTLTQGTDTINTNWNEYTPSSGSATLSHGDLISIVLDFTNRAGSDALTTHAVSGLVPTGFPTGSGFTASWAATGAPVVRLTFSDGTLGWIDGISILAGAPTAVTWADASNPDEYGTIFQVPFNCKVDALWAQLRTVDANSDFDITLYSTPTGTPSSLATVSVLSEQYNAVAQNNVYHHTLASEVSLTANTDYCVAVKATGSANVRTERPNLIDADARKLFSGGTTVQGVSRNNSSGAFGSASTTAIPLFGVRISDITTSGSSGGVPLIGPGGLVY